jgi:hypothetical protein
VTSSFLSDSVGIEVLPSFLLLMDRIPPALFDLVCTNMVVLFVVFCKMHH